MISKKGETLRLKDGECGSFSSRKQHGGEGEGDRGGTLAEERNEGRGGRVTHSIDTGQRGERDRGSYSAPIQREEERRKRGAKRTKIDIHASRPVATI